VEPNSSGLISGGGESGVRCLVYDNVRIGMLEKNRIEMGKKGALKHTGSCGKEARKMACSRGGFYQNKRSRQNIVRGRVREAGVGHEQWSTTLERKSMHYSELGKSRKPGIVNGTEPGLRG